MLNQVCVSDDVADNFSLSNLFKFIHGVVSEKGFCAKNDLIHPDPALDIKEFRVLDRMIAIERNDGTLDLAQLGVLKDFGLIAHLGHGDVVEPYPNLTMQNVEFRINKFQESLTKKGFTI